MKKTVSAHVYNTIERYPQILKMPKVEKAMGNLKCWMALRVNRGFDNSSVFCHRSDLGLLLHGYLVVKGEAGETGWSLGILPRSRVHSPFRTQVSCSGYISSVGNVAKCSAQVE